MDALARLNTGPGHMHDMIKDIKSYEVRVFGDRESMSHTLQYGDKTLNNEVIRKYLGSGQHDWNDISAVLDHLLTKGNDSFVQEISKACNES